MNIDQSLKKEFINLLKSTERDGVDDLLEELEDLGFFDAPASSRFHLNYDGGLVEHSLNVCHVALGLRDQMIGFNKEMEEYLPKDSVIIASLLHDVCKADIYKKVTKRRKDKRTGNVTVSEGFKLDYTNFPMGHGEKSAIVCMRAGLAMTDYELLAIRWHMSAWDLPFQSADIKENLNKARDICPLCAIIQTADTLATNILERKRTDEDEDEYVYLD
ncbi:MAG: HD family phosphohydrolase [Bacteroidales bacterium]|nr:HD family phosphohydrolase [Bacteroidales bacterium]